MCQIYFQDNSKIEEIKIKLGLKFKLNEENYLPFAFSERQYEIHERFIDVQFLLSGQEDIYIAASSKFEENLNFNLEKDIAFFAAKPKEDLIVSLRPGLFCVIFPGEAHMPCIRSRFAAKRSVHKVVAKIPLEDWKLDPLLFNFLGE